ncbi:aldo/keto reductase [Marinilabilia rubra]|uniref:Aldo/keto reductase n=1 Tax=Marinilabilia rubra TaxID=2162893 RepID=A0A2U2BAA1_9BACT|nr:aldo/keto reductase [Marinilabilia rubra]PWD99990.1 aldo/keto reductase [Marinilabilia rubra]
MEYRHLSDSNLQLSAITFGAWAAGSWMWGHTETKDAVGAIRAAYEEGVTSIDTAPVYGMGASENIVGKAISDFPRDKVQILTKFGLRWDLPKGKFYFKSKNNEGQFVNIHKYAGKESVIEECENSLRRLGTDYIDLYQIHWPDETTPIEETFEAVERLIDQGKIRYAGVCNYNAEQVKKASKVVNIISDQVPFSMVNREIEDETLPFCLKNNKAILAYSPLERGLLTGKMKPGQTFAEGDHRKFHPSFKDESIKKTNAFLKDIMPLADAKNITLAQLVLRWTLEREGITIALAGARNADQARQNAKAGEVHLTVDELEFINQKIVKL